MYNPKTQLPLVDRTVTYATLTRLDGKGVYDFLINPSIITGQYSAAFNQIPVLKTTFNRLNYTSSSTAITLPDVKFYTKGNMRDLSKVLEGLKAMTRPVAEGQWLPACKFVWGVEVYNLCYLSDLTVTVTQRIGGKPTEANGSMTLVIGQEKTAIAAPKSETDNAIQLTTKELSRVKDNMTKAIKSASNTLSKLPANVKKAYATTLSSLEKMKEQANSATRFLHINIKPDGSGEAVAGTTDSKGKQTTDKRLTLPKALLEAIDPATYKHTNEKTASSKIE